MPPRYRLLYFLGAVLLIFTVFNARRWSRGDVLEFDPGGYVAPIYSVVLHGQLGRADSLIALEQRYRPARTAELTSPKAGGTFGRLDFPTGAVITKYPVGMSVVLAPFYTSAHLLTRWLGRYPADGYSRPYQQAVVLAGLCYGLLGLWLLRRALRLFFTETITAWVVLGLAFGSNLFNYIGYESAMPHATLFLWQAGLLLATVQWYRSGRLADAAAIGLCLGMAGLTRPSELLFVLVPLLWGVADGATLRQRPRWLWQRRGSLLVAGGVLVAVLAVQLLYWRVTTGAWLVYAYGDERFHFADPHVFDGLFSFRKGWLLYSPLLAFALVGIGWTRRYVPAALGPLVGLLPVLVYVTFCWWQWWYGASFGCRPLISAYPLLALPLASLLTAAAPHPVRRRALEVVIGLFVVLNVWQTRQYRAGILHWDSETAAMYVRNFLRM